MNLKTILIAEDNPNDVELTLMALADYNLANNIQVVSDGVEVLEYLRFQGRFKDRKPGNPAVFILAMKQLGAFWAVLNEIP